MERDDDGFAAAKQARARGAERLRDLEIAEGPEESPRDRAAVDVALDQLDTQIACLQEGVASVIQRLGPAMRPQLEGTSDDAWAQLEIRGASPLAQGIMDRADTLGRLNVHLRTMYGRIDL